MKIDSLIAQFGLQSSWYLNALENITEEESNLFPVENLNSIKWVAGHILNTRISMLGILGQRINNEQYQKLFGKGSPGKPDTSYPGILQLKEDWISIAAELKTVLQNTHQEKWMSKPPFQTAIPDETLLGLMAYFSMHESFHIGQLSVLRKQIGKQTMGMGK